jgi:hypothetical protein
VRCSVERNLPIPVSLVIVGFISFTEFHRDHSFTYYYSFQLILPKVQLSIKDLDITLIRHQSIHIPLNTPPFNSRLTLSPCINLFSKKHEVCSFLNEELVSGILQENSYTFHTLSLPPKRHCYSFNVVGTLYNVAITAKAPPPFFFFFGFKTVPIPDRHALLEAASLATLLQPDLEHSPAHPKDSDQPAPPWQLGRSPTVSGQTVPENRRYKAVCRR